MGRRRTRSVDDSGENIQRIAPVSARDCLVRVLMISGVAGKAEAGVAGIVYNLTRELRELGHSVTPMFAEDLLPNPRWPLRFRAYELSRSIAQYVEKTKSEYDVVNIHAPWGFWYGKKRRRTGSAAGPPYVMTMHGLEERRNYAMGREAQKGRADYFRWKNRVWQRLYHMPTYEWSFRSADQCIVTNRESMIYLQLHYDLAPGDVWFVANGVGKEFFGPRVRGGEEATKLLFLGTWIDHKGVHYLAEAFSKVLAVKPASTLTIAGCLIPEAQVRGFFPEAAQSAIQVRSFVPRAEIPEVYASHDIFVLPSLMEGMPLVILEAMASGMAVLTSESTGMIDLIEDGHDGLFVIPGESESLVAGLLRLIGDADLRLRLGLAAQEKMRRYTWKHAAERNAQVFSRAINR